MRRWLYTYEYVHGDPAVLEQRVQEDLPDLLHRSLAAVADYTAVDGSFVVDLPAELAGKRVTKRARVSTGVAHRTGTRLLLPVRWHAEPGMHAFPWFDGHLEVEPLSRSQVQLSLVGSYRTPLGPLGGVADAAALHAVARRTAEEVLRGVVGQLSASGATPAAALPQRRWPLRVHDVMTPDPLVLDPTLPLKSAALLLFHAEVSGAPVVGDDGALIGVLSEHDLLAKEAPERFGFGRAVTDDRRRRRAVTVAEACTTPAIVTVPHARLADAALSMLEHDVSRLVVVDHGRVAGIVSRHDVLAALVRDDTELHAAVLATLADVDARDVSVEVSWGQVTLSGPLALRSSIPLVVAAVRDVDGVMDVDADELIWEVDDVIPIVPVL